ncbi:centrosomal protein of 162 kDa isoform X1 [Lutzomyia longipalpis]|uniref:centrosomal protein of 162 kDa isoform X1 n=1 Tax=Lutzomyia longipalpis TaxID=7200 RepID=UPI00248334BA|nr:centrosomal protein of 162 kDa isoform X1 [Lutzomyia longipalpis]
MASACVSSKGSGEIREKRLECLEELLEQITLKDAREESRDFFHRDAGRTVSAAKVTLPPISRTIGSGDYLDGQTERNLEDIESIFEEINRLSDNSDERSVEEILKEAEMLMHLTSQSLSGRSDTPRDHSDAPEVEEEEEKEAEDVRTRVGSNTEKVEKSGGDDIVFDEIAISVQVKNQESSPAQPPAVLLKLVEEVMENSRDKCIGTDTQFLDKFTTPSPPMSLTPINEDSWPLHERRALEDEISSLQEKLKDTQERFQSLRLQHDTVTAHHRSLRESQSSMQEETDRLKLEVQHLTECITILRSEVQAARGDRAEVQEVQKVLQTELEEARAEKKKLQEQTDRDSKIILDLQRQCKEMERILMRKHPDSVSALIVASKGVGNAKEEASTRRILEQRIAQLEADAKQQDAKAQKILANVQAKFSTVQSKYETHIADLETQVLSLQEINTKLTQKIEAQSTIIRERNSTVFSSTFTQTDELPERDVTVEKISAATQTDQKATTTGKQSATPKKASGKIVNSYSESQINHGNDSHLMATIRGMRVDLAIKEKALQRLTRELDECKKTIRKTQQKERESSAALSTKTAAKKTLEVEGHNGVDASSLKEAQNKIKLLEFDYKSLHDKRLQDLRTLQAAHEKELASCHETVNILQQRLKERDEAFAMQKRRRVPVDYYALKAKKLRKSKFSLLQQHRKLETDTLGGLWCSFYIQLPMNLSCGGAIYPQIQFYTSPSLM